MHNPRPAGHEFRAATGKVCPAAISLPDVFCWVKLPFARAQIAAAALSDCRAVVSLLIVLALLVTVPVPAVSHNISTPPGGPDHRHDCHVQGYDLCHSPSFSHMTFTTTFSFVGNAYTDQVTHSLGESDGFPWALDADHEQFQPPRPDTGSTMVYELRDRNQTVHDNPSLDDGSAPTGDAAAFTLSTDTNGYPVLRARTALSKTPYLVRLVACDGNFRRGFIDLTINVTNPVDPVDTPEPVDLSDPENTNNDNGVNGNNGVDNGVGNNGNVNGNNGNVGGDGGNSGEGIDNGDENGVTRSENTRNWPRSSVTRSFPENSPPGTSVGPPVGPPRTNERELDYALQGPDALSFGIDADTGQIKTISGVIYDYETRSSYVVTVRATRDGGRGYLIEVTINVIDVREGPVFESRPARRNFPENTPPDRNIGAPVTARQGDGGPLTYRLAGPGAEYFDIQATTAQLRTKAGVNYDYETRSLYSARVTATDRRNASASITVTIEVADVAEKPGTPRPPGVRPLEDSGTILRVRWVAPGRNGGPPIIGYDLEYRQGSSGDWNHWPHSGIQTTQLITGLLPGTVYQARVRALNGEIPGDWSGPGSGQTHATVKGWLARFARTVAQGMLESVEDRLRSPRRIGMHARAGGIGIGDGLGSAPEGADYRSAFSRAPDRAFWARRDGMDSVSLPRYRLLAEDQLLTSSTFELTGETLAGGAFGLWGRGGFSRFDGLEGRTTLDGDVMSGTVGADYAKGPWLAGLALSHSWGIGGYGRAHGPDDIESLLTGLYPYAGYKVTNRMAVWGVGGHGQGVLTLTPQGGYAMQTNIGLTMAALAARGVLVSSMNGFDVALQTDAFWVHATSEGLADLLETEVTVTRLRLALESAYQVALQNGAMLTPKLEAGVRHDEGDAETGLGVDIGGGFVWLAPARGISVEMEARSLVGHEVGSFRDWGLSGLVRYDPNPFSERGLSAYFRSSIGQAMWGSTGVLSQLDTLAALATQGDDSGGQLRAEAAYGLPLLGSRFVGSPWVGAGVLPGGHDYRVGYRISPARQSQSALHLGIEGVRRENIGSDGETEHALALRLGTGW